MPDTRTLPIAAAHREFTVKPGQRVEISAGAGRDQAVLFVGIVVRHGLKASERAAPQLVIDCRHAASKLTVTPRSSSHFDATDSDIIETVLGAAGLQGEIETTTAKHPQVL